jgi:hypothetical protein
MQITRQADYALRAVWCEAQTDLARRLAQATFGQLARQPRHASQSLALASVL